MDDLLVEFIAETRETLESLSGEIIAWEANPDDRARLDAIFRFVHTVKGSCGFLDLPRLARLSHAAEDVLADVRDGKRRPDPSLVNAVLSVVDRIGEIVEAIDAGAALDDSGEDLLIAALAEGGIGPQPPAIPVVQGFRSAARSVRLNVDLLDRMMSGMSDMVLARNELARRLRDHDVDPAIEASLERLSATVAEMRDTVTRTRMQKVEALFSPLPRMVRDTAAACAKSVTLNVEGSEVELDREMIELMRDPLVHIIRNAIDHGIESPMERRAAGKRENGRLTVSARQSGNQIVIDIADDGRGIDPERLIAKLVRAGRSESELRALSPRERLELIFEPGLSTKDEVTEISGRGVGMDVVRACIEQIGGRILLDNMPGHGLRVSIHVPLTLSIIPTIVVGLGGQRFAMPRQTIEEIVMLRGDTIRIDRLGDQDVATVRGRRLPLVNLCAMLGLNCTGRMDGDGKLVIVSVGTTSYVVAVDSVLDNEELVIKPAAPAIMACGLFAGQTLPDNGVPMLILDCAGIAAAAGVAGSGTVMADSDGAADDDAGERGYPALLIHDLDGARRIVPLAAVDRVEQVTTDAIRESAGRLRMTIDGTIIPLATVAPVDGLDRVSVLRLHDGATEIGYAVRESVDIVQVTEPLVPAAAPGHVAGVTLVDGEPTELLDLIWLFATHGDHHHPAAAVQPLCLIGDDASGWTQTFLRPIIEGMGFRVTQRLRGGERADLLILSDDTPVPADGPAQTVVTLRAAPEPDPARPESVWRYDREAVVAAVKQSLRRKGA
ncbi:chemotaxis protein CheW [Sphingomonas sp. BGYR3]|uniref:chemotaxis protein CheA n=1 Tax=Sphingomonas sp. BGYR3 TaxID=2975483 RepID=UPI0021A5205F|nr:chemotaxis protein CheW [Sphingomonas sp. BGYR3]MDG5487551.1 chemotaxis protein CheW [Sphingomonas sp. BGYR3]